MRFPETEDIILEHEILSLESLISRRLFYVGFDREMRQPSIPEFIMLLLIWINRRHEFTVILTRLDLFLFCLVSK